MYLRHVRYESYFVCAGITPGSDCIADGGKEGEGIMYHANSYPWDPIGVVWFLWKFQPLEDRCSTSALAASLWVWCHPCIHEEVLRVLTLAAGGHVSSEPSSALKNSEGEDTASHFSHAELQVDSLVCALGADTVHSHSSVVPTSLVSVVSLKDELLRFRLIGSKSQEMLATVFRPEFDLTSSSDATETEAVLHLKNTRKWEDISEKSSLRKWWERHLPVSRHALVLSDHCNSIKNVKPTRLQFGSVFGMTILDPRLFTPVKRDNLIAAAASKTSRANADLDRSGSESESGWSESGGSESFISQATRSTPLNSDTGEMEALPTELAYSPLWDTSIRNAVANSIIPHHILNEVRSKFFVKPEVVDLGSEGSRVPVLLVSKSQVAGFGSRLAHKRIHVPAVTGWDVILPRSWGMAFWISLVYHGGRACGMEELDRTSLELLRPIFPQDFPDTKSGIDLALHERVVLEEKYCRYPPDKRPNFGKLQISVPFHSPWSVLLKEHQKEFGKLSNGKRSRGAPDVCSEPKRVMLKFEGGSEIEDIQTSVTPVAREESLSLAKKVLSSTDVYVLRERKCIHAISEFAEQLLSHCLPPGVAYGTLIKQHEMAHLCETHESALLAVQVETARQGVLTLHSTVSVPTMDDLRKFREDKDFPGPCEDKASRGLTLIENGELCVGMYQTSKKDMKARRRSKAWRRMNSSDISDKGLFDVV